MAQHFSTRGPASRRILAAWVGPHADGLLDPSPTPDEKILTRNYGRGPNQYTVNLRLAKTIGFGPAKLT
jgi:hypothetical protein